MKAERRHELQENSLVRGIRTFPQFWKEYGSKICLVIILFLLALVLVRYWLNSREVTQQAIGEQLTSARTVLEQYRQGTVGSSVLDNDPKAQQLLLSMSSRSGEPLLPLGALDIFLGAGAEDRVRGRVKEKVEAAVAETLKNSSDPARQAEATLLRADLNYHFGILAQAASAAVPATQPTTKAFDKTPEQYFESAAKDYGELIAQAGKIPARTATAARFGMAAIHENRDEIPKARELYDAISKDGPDPTVKKLASARIDRMTRYVANPLIGQPSKPKVEKPATKPEATSATTEANTRPAATTTTTTTTTLTTAPTVPAPTTVPTTRP